MCLDLTLGDIVPRRAWKAALATSLGPSLLIAMAAMAAGIVAQRTASVSLARCACRPLRWQASASRWPRAGTLPRRPAMAGTGRRLFPARRWRRLLVGALAPLLAMAWRQPRGYFRICTVFAHGGAGGSVLALTGLPLAIIQLQSFGALIETKYGIILSIS